MASLTLSLSGISDLQKLQAFTNPDLHAKAIAGGIAYASKAVPPAVAKGIGAAYNIKAARIKQDISRVRFDPGGEAATIGFSRRSPTLAQFNPRPGTRARQPGLGRGRGWGPPTRPGRPLTATVIRSQGRRPYSGAFLATGASGNNLVLRRAGDRLQAVYGPSIGSIFLGRSAIAPQLQADVSARINEQFIKGFERVLASAARGFAR